MEACVKVEVLNVMDGTILPLPATRWESLGPKTARHSCRTVTEHDFNISLGISTNLSHSFSLILDLNSVTLHILHISHIPVSARNGAKDNSLMFSIYHHAKSVCVCVCECMRAIR